jgi:uncharacterized protein (DUF111 family)
MVLHGTGYGAGSADLALPNVLRVWLGERLPAGVENDLGDGHASGDHVEAVTVLETSVDDMNPQVCGYLFERLMALGALDVYSTSIGMKKNRPGILLTVLCASPDAARFQQALLAETTTLGVRSTTMYRTVARRSVLEVDTPLGSIRVKVKWLGGRPVAFTPEYEDCAMLARQHRRPLLEVLEIARASARIRAGDANDDPNNLDSVRS